MPDTYLMACYFICLYNRDDYVDDMYMIGYVWCDLYIYDAHLQTFFFQFKERISSPFLMNKLTPSTMKNNWKRNQTSCDEGVNLPILMLRENHGFPCTWE